MVKRTPSSNCEVHVLKKTPIETKDGKLDYERFREIQSPMGTYLLVEKGEEFFIKVISNTNEVIGAKLYIDEQEIQYTKTFLKTGKFLGFKLGGGHFRSFVFDVPEIALALNPKEVSLKKSEIKVMFFKTFPRYHESWMNNGGIQRKDIQKSKSNYMPSCTFENKKFFQKSMTIKEGDIFKTKLANEKRIASSHYDQERGCYREDVVDLQCKVDEVVIKYGDFTTLQIQGVISLSNIHHLDLIPENFIKQNKSFAERALITIVRYFQKAGISIDQLEMEFRKWTGYSFKEVGVGTINAFVGLIKDKLSVDSRDYKIRALETEKSIVIDLKDISFGSKMTTDYYNVPVDKKKALRGNMNPEKNIEQLRILSGNGNVDGSSNVVGAGKKVIFIDLTEEIDVEN